MRDFNYTKTIICLNSLLRDDPVYPQCTDCDHYYLIFMCNHKCFKIHNCIRTFNAYFIAQLFVPFIYNILNVKTNFKKC